MNLFFGYLSMGFEHISDFNGYDHMLFIMVLCAVYKAEDWKKIALLITAFTVGHSLTLALSALKVITPGSYAIELLIPLTILAASVANILQDPSQPAAGIRTRYLLALLFGCIHGMGFSNFFNVLVGDSMDITLPLFAFNIGLELGQLLIVVLFFGIYFILTRIKDISPQSWNIFISGAGVGVSFIMILERI